MLRMSGPSGLSLQVEIKWPRVSQSLSLHNASQELIIDQTEVIDDRSVVINHRRGHSSSIHHLVNLQT